MSTQIERMQSASSATSYNYQEVNEDESGNKLNMNISIVDHNN